MWSELEMIKRSEIQVLVIVSGLLTLFSCSSEPKKDTEEKKYYGDTDEQYPEMQEIAEKYW